MFLLRLSKLRHEDGRRRRRLVYLSGTKKERLQDSMIVLDNQESRWNNREGSRRDYFFFLIRLENSFHVLLPFFVTVYRCSLQSHEFNRARWLAQSSFPGCLPGGNGCLIIGTQGRNSFYQNCIEQLFPFTRSVHAPLKIFETRYKSEAIKTQQISRPLLRLFYLLDRSGVSLLPITF